MDPRVLRERWPSFWNGRRLARPGLLRAGCPTTLGYLGRRILVREVTKTQRLCWGPEGRPTGLFSLKEASPFENTHKTVWSLGKLLGCETETCLEFIICHVLRKPSRWARGSLSKKAMTQSSEQSRPRRGFGTPVWMSFNVPARAVTCRNLEMSVRRRIWPNSFRGSAKNTQIFSNPGGESLWPQTKKSLEA